MNKVPFSMFTCTTSKKHEGSTHDRSKHSHYAAQSTCVRYPVDVTFKYEQTLCTLLRIQTGISGGDKNKRAWLYPTCERTVRRATARRTTRHPGVNKAHFSILTCMHYIKEAQSLEEKRRSRHRSKHSHHAAQSTFKYRQTLCTLLRMRSCTFRSNLYKRLGSASSGTKVLFSMSP